MKINQGTIKCREPSQSQGNRGFSLPELMIAVVIIFTVVAGSVELTLRSLRMFNQGVVREILEAVVAEDLGWLRAFSKSWHCEVGPYQGCRTQTKGLASAINYRPEVYDQASTSAYQIFRSLCLNREDSSSTATPAHKMLYDAAAISSTSSYAPPNTIIPEDDPATESIDESALGQEVKLDVSDTPLISQNYKVYRTLNVNSGGNSITVRYFTKNSDDPSLPIYKVSQLFVEATAWCP